MAMQTEDFFRDFVFDYSGCADHLRDSDWNADISDSAWRVEYTRSVNCIRYAQQLAEDAAAQGQRPSAFAGVHVPTVIVPTKSEDVPELPPLYFVLPFWDTVVSNRLRLFGSYDHQELDILLRLTLPGAAFVDIGANVGAVAVPMAAHVGEDGVVYAFEPFRQVFQFLNANVAANGLANVHTYQSALSDDSVAPATIRSPAPTLRAAQNAGMSAVFKSGTAEHAEKVSELRERLEDVSVRTLDSFALPRADVVKIDVEGHAERVLAGAVATIARHRPILWFEENGESSPEVLRAPELQYWCTRLSDTTEAQFLCVPQEHHAEIQARLVAERPTFQIGTPAS